MDIYQNNKCEYYYSQNSLTESTNSYFSEKHQSISRKSSILKTKSRSQTQTVKRTDSQGNLIEKHGRHKINFKSPLITKYEVENWKEYNVDVNEEGVCTCKIF